MKHTYYKVIQQKWEGVWCDVDYHETNSSGLFKSREDRDAFRANLKAYRDNQSAPVRSISRRELNT